MIRLLAAALFAAASGCGPGQTSRPAPDPPTPREAAEPSPVDLRPGASLDRILAPRDDAGPFLDSLRPPRQRRVEAVQNRHVSGQVDSLVTLVYDGLEIEAYEVAGGETFIRRLSVTGSDYGTASGLSVGETRSDLESALGPPTDGRGTYATADGPTPTLVEVTYEPDAAGVERASEIVWSPPID